MSSSQRIPSRTDLLHDVSNSNQTPLKRRRLPPKPSSVLEIFIMLILNSCKYVVFYDPYFRIFIYSVCLFAISSIADVVNLPKFFYNSFLNQYFVKLGWFWTLLVSLPFVFMTSSIYCSGKPHLLPKHFARLAVATFFWFFWVNFFEYVEHLTGECLDREKFKTKKSCLIGGSRWNGFDLSGHAFILIYSNLVLIEEARPIIGWEGIREIIEKEDHSRINELKVHTPLREFTSIQFNYLRSTYEKYLPYVRLNFALITCLIIVWDYMLLSTIMYFHSMPEKLLSGFIAMLTWFLTYEIWFKRFGVLPGQGTFIYSPPRSKK